MFVLRKKLKKIPSDLVSYIQIETEAIKDANDKMMISSYCLGKLELVNWYLELLEVGSKKYIVPQKQGILGDGQRSTYGLSQRDHGRKNNKTWGTSTTGHQVPKRIRRIGDFYEENDCIADSYRVIAVGLFQRHTGRCG